MLLIYDKWVADKRELTELKAHRIRFLQVCKPFAEQQLRSLDSTLKKVTTFTKKLKTIGASTIPQLLLDLEKLNLSKYLDEIAINICEAKLEISDLDAMVEFSVTVSAIYKEFPMHLLAVFRKQMPSKKGDKIEDPFKLSFNLRFFTELLLTGFFGREGLQLLGSVLAFLVNIDKFDHLNTSVLIPFCQSYLFSITAILPFSVMHSMVHENRENQHEDLASTIFVPEHRNILAVALDNYWQSLVDYTKRRFIDMNKLSKTIRRQELTRGKTFREYTIRFQEAKQQFEHLRCCVDELGECLGHEPYEFKDDNLNDNEEKIEETPQV